VQHQLDQHLQDCSITKIDHVLLDEEYIDCSKEQEVKKKKALNHNIQETARNIA
jgi:hypothetical protein